MFESGTSDVKSWDYRRNSKGSWEFRRLETSMVLLGCFVKIISWNVMRLGLKWKKKVVIWFEGGPQCCLWSRVKVWDGGCWALRFEVWGFKDWILPSSGAWWGIYYQLVFMLGVGVMTLIDLGIGKLFGWNFDVYGLVSVRWTWFQCHQKLSQ